MPPSRCACCGCRTAEHPLCPLLIFGVGPFSSQLASRARRSPACIGRGTGVLYQLWTLFRGGRAHPCWVRRSPGTARCCGTSCAPRSAGGADAGGDDLVDLLMRHPPASAAGGGQCHHRHPHHDVHDDAGLGHVERGGDGSAEPHFAATGTRRGLGAAEIGKYNMAYLVAIAVLFFLFPQAIVGFFSADPQVVAVGAEWLRIRRYSLFVYGWWMWSACRPSTAPATPRRRPGSTWCSSG